MGACASCTPVAAPSVPRKDTALRGGAVYAVSGVSGSGDCAAALRAHAKPRPVRLTSRASISRAEVMTQLAAASARKREQAPQPGFPGAKRVDRAKSRVALERRMSTLTDTEIESLELKMREWSSHSSDNPDAMDADDTARLIARLKSLGLEMRDVRGDGACQFRALAFQLYGNEAGHKDVRAAVVEHMRRNESFFGPFFGDEFDAYLRDMSRDDCWGDELTLRAAVEAFGCTIVVVTSRPSSWFLEYRAEDADATTFNPVHTTGQEGSIHRKTLYLSYIFPVHYTAIVASRVH